MRSYEIMFILRPDLEETEMDRLIEGFQKNVTDGGGEIKTTEKMGRRRLAYTVRKFNDGFYVLLVVSAEGALITEVERRLRVSEQVIKFITIRTDEEEKRVAKIKAYRDSHVKRSALPQVQASAPVSSPEASAPETSTAGAPAPETAATEPEPAEAVAAETTTAAEPEVVTTA